MRLAEREFLLSGEFHYFRVPRQAWRDRLAAMADAGLRAASIYVLRRVVLPLIAPGIAATAVIVFLTAWAAYLIPLTFAPTLAAEPLTVLIPQYASRFSQDYGLQAAAGLIALLPPAAVVIWLNRHLMRGLLTGALKQ